MSSTILPPNGVTMTLLSIVFFNKFSYFTGNSKELLSTKRLIWDNTLSMVKVFVRYNDKEVLENPNALKLDYGSQRQKQTALKQTAFSQVIS